MLKVQFKYLFLRSNSYTRITKHTIFVNWNIKCFA